MAHGALGGESARHTLVPDAPFLHSNSNPRIIFLSVLIVCLSSSDQIAVIHLPPRNLAAIQVAIINR